MSSPFILSGEDKNMFEIEFVAGRGSTQAEVVETASSCKRTASSVIVAASLRQSSAMAFISSLRDDIGGTRQQELSAE
jgi:hypothetical protein